MNQYIFIVAGFVLLIGTFIPFVVFLRNTKRVKAQIIFDKTTVFSIVFITLCDMGMLICYLLSGKNSALPLFLSLSLSAILGGVFSQHIFAFSQQILYVGVKKYNIEQLHILSVEKERQNRILIKAEIAELESSSKEITLWLTETNYQKFGAIFQKKMSCSQSTD